MRGRVAGRIGASTAPTARKAGGAWHLSEVISFIRDRGWPVDPAGRVSLAVKSNSMPSVKIENEVKVNGGSFA